MVARVNSRVPAGPKIRCWPLVASLMPAGDDQLIEIDHVIRVQVGQQQGFSSPAPDKPGSGHPLGHARAAVDQEAPVADADQARRAEAMRVNLGGSRCRAASPAWQVRPPPARPSLRPGSRDGSDGASPRRP